MIQALMPKSQGGVATKIGTPNGRTIRVTVLTANAVIYFAHDPTSLNTPPPLVGVAGQKITETGGQVQEIWEGELWAISYIEPTVNAFPIMVDVDILDSNAAYPLNP